MLNDTSKIDISSNPKFQFLNRLLRQCYLNNATNSRILTTDYSKEDQWCPRTFDGFACWDETPASTTAFQPCPGFVVGFDPRRNAFKRCTENGTWYTHPEANKPWTNYTTCVDVEDLDFRNLVNNIYVVGYAVSVAALILSMIIFLYFRSLQCTRIRIHVHLFSSLVMNNILWIVWYKTVVNKVAVVQDNKEWCQVLHVVTNYFMVTGYIWMFCEGLHLHIALVVVFVKEDIAIRWFMALGWGLPLLIVTVYASVRYMTPGATARCWMDQSDTFWIIIIPVVISLLASFVFLVNVVRVLLTKLHPGPNQRASVATRKAARAALILIPLFGLHFILIPLRPPTNAPGEKLYQVVSALLTSLQGLCVSVLFCFTNHDVVSVTKTHLSRLWTTNDGIAMTGVTGGESLAHTRDHVI